jgi:hypothetical protein
VPNTRSGALHRLTPVCAILLSVAACSHDKSPAPAATAQDSASATPAAAPTPDPVGLVPLPEDQATKDLASYRLTLPMLQRWAQAQNAVDSATNANPQLFESMKKAAPRTLDEMISVIGAQAPIRDALKRHGFTVHDYVLTMIAMNQAINGYQRKAAGQTLPPNLPPVLADNIAFVGQNLPAIQQMLAPAKKPR